jgi:hypothetical protein
MAIMVLMVVIPKDMVWGYGTSFNVMFNMIEKLFGKILDWFMGLFKNPGFLEK